MDGTLEPLFGTGDCLGRPICGLFTPKTICFTARGSIRSRPSHSCLFQIGQTSHEAVGLSGVHVAWLGLPDSVCAWSHALSSWKLNVGRTCWWQIGSSDFLFCQSTQEVRDSAGQDRFCLCRRLVCKHGGLVAMLPGVVAQRIKGYLSCPLSFDVGKGLRRQRAGHRDVCCLRILV